jgi:hypothetical protein
MNQHCNDHHTDYHTFARNCSAVADYPELTAAEWTTLRERSNGQTPDPPTAVRNKVAERIAALRKLRNHAEKVRVDPYTIPQICGEGIFYYEDL